MVRRVFGISFGVVASLGIASGAMAVNCPTKLTKEDLALEVRKLQTTLMVAALSCGKRKEYNNFVVSYRPTLKRHGKLMRVHFQKRYGKRSKRRLNSYVTALANQASERMSSDPDGYCRHADTLFVGLKDRKPAQLSSFVQDRFRFGVFYNQANAECGDGKRFAFPDMRGSQANRIGTASGRSR